MSGAGLIYWVGGAALLAGAAALYGLVRFDLGPRAMLRGPRQFALAAALGSGVIAFAFKYLAILLVAQAPSRALAPVSTRPPQDSQNAAVVTFTIEPRPWRALPDMAPFPRENPTTREKADLGRRLFFDPALSRDRQLACATCHEARRGGADGRSTSRGAAGAIGARNAPSVFNAAFQTALFWDGRARSLEEQAKGPLVNPIEMAMPDLAAVVRRVSEDASYAPLFDAAFGTAAIDIDRIAAAIAAYERTLITPDAPYDRFVKGDAAALDASQRRGMALFQEFGCIQCHSGANFSSAAHGEKSGALRIFPIRDHPLVDRYGLRADSGAAGSPGARGLWRVPSLRNVALTAPYFHNGAVHDLADAVRIMIAVQCNIDLEGEQRDPLIVWRSEAGLLDVAVPRRASERDVQDIVAFLRALSSDKLLSAEVAEGGDGQAR